MRTLDWLQHVSHSKALSRIADDILEMEKAIAFLDLCRQSPTATETGAYKDAWGWIESAARKLTTKDDSP